MRGWTKSCSTSPSVSSSDWHAAARGSRSGRRLGHFEETVPTRGARILPRVTRRAIAVGVSALAACLCQARPTWAHVGMDSPAPDSVVLPGQTVTVTWTDLILHEGIGYDLDLLPSVDAVDGIPVVHGLSVATHRFDWAIPDLACNGCYLRVTQVN